MTTNTTSPLQAAQLDAPAHRRGRLIALGCLDADALNAL